MPEKLTGSGPQTACSARTNSSKPLPRLFNGTFAAWNSSQKSPWPIPAIALPPLNRSKVAKRRARVTGFWKSALNTLSLGLVGRSIRSLTQRDASPIFSASKATWRIVSGETIDPYCGRAIPIETLGLADRFGGADHCVSRSSGPDLRLVPA